MAFGHWIRSLGSTTGKSMRKFKRRVAKKKIPKGYDSQFEYDLHEDILSGWSHHPAKVSYVSAHTYEPDFCKIIEGKVIYIEAKGRFRSRPEAAKYCFIRDSLSENEELIFIFYDASKPLVGAQKRKDGTKMSHGEWAEKNNFRYYCRKKGLPKEIK